MQPANAIRVVAKRSTFAQADGYGSPASTMHLSGLQFRRHGPPGLHRQPGLDCGIRLLCRMAITLHNWLSAQILAGVIDPNSYSTPPARLPTSTSQAI